MDTICAIIIAKNAGEDIADCLTSVSFCTDILVVDNMSTDSTVAIAKKMRARIIKNNSKSFSDLRNAGLKAASTAWLFYIDADERVSPHLKKEILDVLSGGKNDNAYRIKRKNFYLGRHPWPHSELLERLFKTSFLRGWKGDLHESPEVSGSIGELKGYLEHYSHKNLTSMLDKTIVWSETEANLRREALHPQMTWWRFPRVMATAFWNSYVKQSGWKAGSVGIIESVYQAYSIFITYARLWELQQSVHESKH